MIKFFRRIRQQLLTENKFSKYLLYAIGGNLIVLIAIFLSNSKNNINGFLPSREGIKGWVKP